MNLFWDPVPGASYYQIEMNGRKLPSTPKEPTFIKAGLLPETEYVFRVRCVFGDGVSSWSLYAKGKTQRKEFKAIGWEECFSGDNYYLDKRNVRIVTSNSNESCTVKSNMPLPRNEVSSWRINMFPSKECVKKSFFIGVARYNGGVHGGKAKMDGWYFCCSSLELFSGLHLVRKASAYGPRIEGRKFIRSVGVIMDASKGTLSFVLDGINYGVAFEGIPCDTDIYPSVILGNKGDAVELNLSVVKENVSYAIPIPKRLYIITDSWRSVGLSWDAIDGTTRYQVEVNGSLLQPISTNMFVKKDASPDTEYSFRVRSVRGDGASAWSDPLKWRTKKKVFENVTWQECPPHLENERMFIVNEINPRIVENAGTSKHSSTVIGGICIPEGKVSFWSVKVLKSLYGTSSNIYVGVAPQNINQSSGVNQKECG